MQEPPSPTDKNVRGSRSRRASSHDNNPAGPPAPSRHQQAPLQSSGYDIHPAGPPPPSRHQQTQLQTSGCDNYVAGLPQQSRHQQTPQQTPGHGQPLHEYFQYDATRSLSPAPDHWQGMPSYPTAALGASKATSPIQETLSRGPDVPPRDNKHSDSGDLDRIANGIVKIGRNIFGESRRESQQEPPYRESTHAAFARLNGENAKLQDWYSKAWYELEKSKAECAKLQEKVRACRSERERLETDYREYEKQAKAKIDEMQRQSHKHLETGRNIGRQRIAVGKDLRDLQPSIKKWVKAYCLPAELFTLEGQAQKDFESETLKVRNTNHDNILPLALIVEALVTAHIFENIIAKPFFFLPGDGNSEYLDEIYKRLQKTNPNEAHVWRSQLLRLLYPAPREDNTNEVVEVRSQTDEQMKEACEDQARKLLEGNVRHALALDAKDSYEKCGKELYDIYFAAGNLSLEIWSTRSCYRVSGLKELKDDNAKFEAGSALVEPHSRMALEEDDPTYDGREIILVVRPALEASGTDEAEKYWQSEVLVKAVVLFDKS